MNQLTEDQIRAIANIAREELGENANFESVRDIVQQVVEDLSGEQTKTTKTGRILVICISFDGLTNSRVLSNALKETNCKVAERFDRNIEGFAIQLALIDPSSCSGNIEKIRARLQQAGNEAGVRVIIQTEDTLRNISEL